MKGNKWQTAAARKRTSQQRQQNEASAPRALPGRLEEPAASCIQADNKTQHNLLNYWQQVNSSQMQHAKKGAIQVHLDSADMTSGFRLPSCLIRGLKYFRRNGSSTGSFPLLAFGKYAYSIILQASSCKFLSMLTAAQRETDVERKIAEVLPLQNHTFILSLLAEHAFAYAGKSYCS